MERKDQLDLMGGAYASFYNKTGPVYQLSVAMGELGELTQAVSNYQRVLLRGDDEFDGHNRADLSNLIEEIADVKNVIFGIEQHLEIQSKVEEVQFGKVNRTIQRFGYMENKND